MPSSALDFGTIFGLSGAFLLLAVAIGIGGSGMAFVDLPSIQIGRASCRERVLRLV